MRLNLEEFARLMHQHGNTTRVSMARALGVDKATITRIFKGQTNPGGTFYARFRAAYPNEPVERYFL